MNIANQYRLTDADYNDCNSLQHGLIRVFCDLHCIRDAVKSGDQAILISLEQMAKISTENTKRLLDYYTGTVLDKLDAQNAPAALLQAQEVQDQTAMLFQEMQSWANEQGGFDTAGSAAVSRALQAYGVKLRSQATEFETDSAEQRQQHAQKLLQHTQELHANIRGVHEARRLRPARRVEQSVTSYVALMQERLAAQSALLGVYHQRSIAGKQRQQHLHQGMTLEDVIQHEDKQAARSLLLQIDSSWWQLRGALDEYLQAGQEQVQAFSSVMELLEAYTSQCSITYPDLWKGYTAAAASENKAHRVLQETWRKTVPVIGLLTAKIVDGDALELFAKSDLLGIEPAAVFRDATTQNGSLQTPMLQQICSQLPWEHSTQQPELKQQQQQQQQQRAHNRTGIENAAAASLLSASAASLRTTALQTVKGALDAGLFGQTVRQVGIAFQEMAMLRDKHLIGGLGEPVDANTIQESAERFADSLKDAMSTIDIKATDLLHQTCLLLA